MTTVRKTITRVELAGHVPDPNNADGFPRSAFPASLYGLSVRDGVVTISGKHRVLHVPMSRVSCWEEEQVSIPAALVLEVDEPFGDEVTTIHDTRPKKRGK